MPSLFVEIRSNVLRALPFLAFVAAMMVALPLLLSDKGSGSTIMLWAILSYFLHRSALFDLGFTVFGKAKSRTGKTVPPEAMGHFLLIYLVLLALAFVPALFAGFKLAEPTGHTKDQFIGVVLLVGLPLTWLLLVLFGTLFPAAAARRRISPVLALRAARKTWWRVGLQLLSLPFLYGLACAFLFSRVSDWSTMQGLDRPTMVGIDILATTLGLIGQVLTVVILTRAYRDGWPDVAAEGSGIAAPAG